MGERYGVWGYPESFVIDRNGYVVERVIGPREWDSTTQVSAFEALLGFDAKRRLDRLAPAEFVSPAGSSQTSAAL